MNARAPWRSGWWVYILACRDGSLYTGATNDLDGRLRAHADGRGARYTRGRAPLRLVYREACDGRSAALKREAAIKRLTRAGKLALIARRRA
jgi:predicted GIY-YIG superfamily endonuclease